LNFFLSMGNAAGLQISSATFLASLQFSATLRSASDFKVAICRDMTAVCAAERTGLPRSAALADITRADSSPIIASFQVVLFMATLMIAHEHDGSKLFAV
jgi:hypothetical protein